MVELELRPHGRLLYMIVGPAFDCTVGAEVFSSYYYGQGKWKGTSFSGSGPGSPRTSIKGQISGRDMSGAFTINDSPGCQLTRKFTGRRSITVRVR